MSIFKHSSSLLASVALCLGMCLGANPAHAAYPDKPIRLIVPFPAGGGTDATARLIAQELGTRLHQAVVVENRAGAAGAIGAQAAVDAAPDGYTLFFSTTGVLVINPYLYKNLHYDPVRDFTPIGPVASSANVLVVNPGVPAHTVKELIDLARKQPGKLTFGSSGIGSSSHLAGVMLESLTGIQLSHIPYKGTAPAISDLVSGRIDMMIDNIPSYVGLANAGKVRPLGVSGATTSPLFPGVPTIAQAGVPGYDVTIWYGILGPAKLPAPVVRTLSAAIAQVVNMPGMDKRLQAIGADPMVQTPQQFGAFISSESKKWERIVKESGAAQSVAE